MDEQIAAGRINGHSQRSHLWHSDVVRDKRITEALGTIHGMLAKVDADSGQSFGAAVSTILKPH